MCFDPVSLGAMAAKVGTGLSSAMAGTMGTIATVGSGVVGAYSSLQQGKAAAAAAEATAQQQEQSAAQQMEAADLEGQRLRRMMLKQRGDNRVALAAGGVDVGSEAAIDLLNADRKEFEEDAYVIRTNAQRSANSTLLQAASTRQAGANAKSQGKWGAASSILSTVSLVGDRHKKYVQQGRYEAGVRA